MNREVACLIAEEASASIDRIAQIANGELAPRVLPNTENRTPDTVLPNTENRTPNTRVYSTPPNQTAIEFMINHTLGMPGAHVEITNTTESASRKLQSAKERENGVVTKDYSILMVACEQQFKDFLPTAIDRLLELAAGVTVQYTHNGKTFTITHKPSARSIDYITSRSEGRFASVLSSLKAKFENPDLNYPYTAEDFDAMTKAERDALYDCALRSIPKISNTHPKIEEDNTPSNSLPSPIYGRRVGDEGYKLNQERSATAGVASPPSIPSYITEANKRLTDFLPKAVNHLKTLARGAQTVIESDTEQNAVEHAPDLKANMYFVNRFLGVPQTVLNIENVLPPRKADPAAVAKLAAECPFAVAKYGSIEAVMAEAVRRLNANT